MADRHALFVDVVVRGFVKAGYALCARPCAGFFTYSALVAAFFCKLFSHTLIRICDACFGHRVVNRRRFSALLVDNDTFNAVPYVVFRAAFTCVLASNRELS